MSRYHQPTQPYTSSANAGPAPAQDPARHDRDDSDSETSTSFNAAAARDDAPAPDTDDPYLALTSQTLNADGTPKRPMNAFMIFARKRRPQISAANQMMRTGDVSKILSKEWNSMEMDEKKFYLDQAKKLKDTFNSKYPDYVYRRRPNNSRKKRKPDAAPDDGAPADGAHPGDGDDPAYDDPSPVDGEDTLMLPSPQEAQYTRAAHAHAHALGPAPGPVYHHPAHHHDPGTPPGCSYPYPSDFHPGGPAPRAQHHLAHQHPHHLAPEPTLGAMRHDLHTPYGAPPPPPLYHQTPSAPSGLYGAGSGSGLWDAGRAGASAAQRAEHARSNWPVLPALDITLARQRSYPSAAGGPGPGSLGGSLSSLGGGGGGKSEAYSPQLPARPWSSATSSTASSSSGGGGGGGGGGGAGGAGGGGGAGGSAGHYGAGQGNAFPTLSSAFFPADSGGVKGADSGASPASASAHDYYSPLHAGGGAARRGSTGPGQQNQDHSAYGQQQYGSQQQQSAAQAWSQHFSRTGGGGGGGGQPQRGSGVALHPISPYALPVQGSPGGEGGAGGGAGPRSAGTPLGFWDDTRFGGR